MLDKDYRVLLLDPSTGHIIAKDFDNKPTLKEIRKLKKNVQRRKGFEDVIFSSYEIQKRNDVIEQGSFKTERRAI